MPNTVKLTAENPEELLNAGAYDAGALIRLQSGASEAGPFADVSGTGATPTPALVAGTRIYTGYDPNGTAATWYRTRFENATGTRVSAWSAAFQVGAGALVGLYDVKQRLDIDAADTTQDENILEWITEVTAFIRGQTGRLLTPDPETEYVVDGHRALRGGSLLRFPHGIQTLTEVAFAAQTGDPFDVIPATDYFLRPLEHEREAGWPATELWMTDNPSASNLHGSIPPGYANVRLRGTFSWLVTPPELQAVALNLLVAVARLGGSSGGEVVTVGLDGERTFSRALSLEDFRVIKRYRIPRSR